MRKGVVLGLFITVGCLAFATESFAEGNINIGGEYTFEEVVFTGNKVDGLSDQGEGTGFIVKGMDLEFLENGKSTNTTELSLVESKVVCPGTEEKECDHYSAELGGLPLDFYFTEEKMYYDLSYYLQGMTDGETYCVYSKQNTDTATMTDIFSAFKQEETELDGKKDAEDGVEDDAENGLAPDEEGEIVFDEPYTLVENSLVTVKLVNFYQTKTNYDQNSAIDKGFTLKVTNNSDRKGGIFRVQPVYLEDEEAGILLKDGNSMPLSGKTGTFHYLVRYQTTESFGDPLNSIDELYDLNGNMEIELYTEDGESLDRDAHEEIEFSFAGLSEKKELSNPNEESESDLNTETEDPEIEETIALLNGEEFYFNGGADDSLKKIAFSEKQAVVSGVTFDGNGKHEETDERALYTADTENIVIKYDNGSEEKIPYKIEADNIVLANGEYKTIEEIKEGLKGHWYYHDKSEVLGQMLGSEKHIIISDDRLDSEKASLAMDGEPGEYYYYGPYSGSYTLSFGGFETEMDHGGEWFWNIIDGQSTVLNYNYICKRGDGQLPGEGGYDFDWYYDGESETASLDSTETSDAKEKNENNEPKEQSQIINYDDNELIKIVQERLNENGYDCGTPDGISGQKTKTAIREYQSEKGLVESGLIDSELLKELGINNEDVPDTAKIEGNDEAGNPWRVSITAELASSAMGRQEAEIKATLSGGPKNGKTKVFFTLIDPTGRQYDTCDDIEYGSGDVVSIYYTNDSLLSGFDIQETAFTTNVYDEDKNLIGSYYGIAEDPQWLIDLKKWETE